MQEYNGYNIIVVYNEATKEILFCLRQKNPYKGFYNFVGGKINPNTDHLQEAYRELKEETGITEKDIKLHHLMDFTYHIHGHYLEIYIGKIKKHLEVYGEENPLLWISLEHADFFDHELYAGEGSIGHIMEIAKPHLSNL